MYQHYSSLRHGAFKYIDQGYINALNRAGHKVIIWDGEDNNKLVEILEQLKPDLFFGYLRKPGTYNNFSWTQNSAIETLSRYRIKNGLKVALFTNPDVQATFGEMKLVFNDKDVSCAPDFYRQIAPPTEEEQHLLGLGFIDTILHCYSDTITSKGYGYWIDKGIPVLSLPLAADDTIYNLSLFKWYRYQFNTLLYVGGWWPFKAQQLDKYIIPLKDRFQNKLKVFGNGWPYLKTRTITDRQFIRKVWNSKINLVFHEPSQVTDIPIHVNERIYKLSACGCFSLCDDNPCLREYFDDNELVICECPEDMIDKAEYYLKHDRERNVLREKARNSVLKRHTYTHRVNKLLDELQSH